jgi:signal peptide peptidase-like protein 2B
MVCEKGENVLDITIPVVMLPVDAGRSLENIVKSNAIGNSSYKSNCTSA